MHQLGQRVGQSARADIVDEQDRIVLAARPATVDDLLTAALHLGVGALHRGEIQIFRRSPRSHAGGRAAAETDQHRRPAEHDQRRARREGTLLDMLVADVAHPACKHDRFVIAAQFFAPVRAGDRLLVGAEIAGQIGPPELVVEGRRADRSLDHDVERRDDASRLAVIDLPGLLEAGDAQIRHREAAQTGLGLGALPGRALVADLAARAGGRARIGGDGGRVVVGLDLHQQMNGFLGLAVDARLRTGDETPSFPAFEHGGVVLVGREHALGRTLGGMTDHGEQRMGLRLAVDHPVGVEDLVPAVLGVGLGEHHQLDIGRIAAERAEVLGQIVDLVVGERQPQFEVGRFQRRTSAADDIDPLHRARLGGLEELAGRVQIEAHHLGHAVVQHGGRRAQHMAVDLGRFAGQIVGDAALQTADRLQAAVVRDVGRLRRPGRDGSRSRHHQHQTSLGLMRRQTRPIAQQTLQDGALLGAEFSRHLGEMHILGIGLDREPGQLAQPVGQFLETEFGEGGRATEDKHRRCSLGT